MQTIAFLGLGRMGQAMAKRLLQCGYPLLIWNRNPAKAVPLLAGGAVWASSPAEAARNATIVFSMVADDVASAKLWLGREGAMQNMQPGSFVIECSTLSAEHVATLQASAKENGLTYIDCPVTGLPEAAAKGQLTLLLGADPFVTGTVKTVLESLSSTIRHMGPPGAGTAYKLVINLMGAVQIAALAEALNLATRLGLNKEAVITAIENSAAASPQVIRLVRPMAMRDFSTDPVFTMLLRSKDAAYGLLLAQSTGSHVPLGEVAATWFKMAALQWPDRDEAAVIEVINKIQ